MTTTWDYLKDGNLFASMVQPFIDLLGSTFGPLFFFGSIYILSLGLVYIKTREPMAVNVMFILTSGVMVAVVPGNIQLYFIVLLIAGVTLGLYQAFRSR